MRNHKKYNIIQKILISLILVVIIFTCIMPKNVYAEEEDNGAVGGLLKEVVQLLASFGDVIMGALNKLMLGSDRFLSVMLSQEDNNLEEDSGSWLVDGVSGETPDVIVDLDYMDEKSFLLDFSTYKIPNILYSPESIFADDIAVLDINFLNPNQYTSIISSGDAEDVERAEDATASAAGGSLQETIASWYKSFRNVAIVGLLSVLVYLGIRIVISSTVVDKAKYKESLRDWLVALCLVAFIHILMAGVLLLTDGINSLFKTSVNEGIIVQATHSDEGKNANQQFKFRTNLIGLARFRAQADQWQDATAYTIIYLALVIYTCIFTVMYLKRFLWMAFFTMISPLVALTYPLDKAGDGHAQAFNLWFKEYTMNAIIQPVHLILYTVFVSSANELAVNNPIYAIVAIAFLIPAEKFVKKMFGLDKAETESDFGSFAGGALAMKGLQTLQGLGNGGRFPIKKPTTENQNNENDGKITFPTKDNAGKLDSYNGGSSSSIPQEGNNEDDVGRISTNYNGGSNGDYAETDSNNGNLTSREGSYMGNSSETDNTTDQESNGSGSGSGSGIGSGSADTPQRRINSPTAGQPERTASQKRKGVGRFAIRGAKKLGKGALFTGKIAGKGAVRTAAMMGGAVLGLAAGVASGDLSKAFTYATTGVIAGNEIGKNINNAIGGATGIIKKAPSTIKNTKNDVVDRWYRDVEGPTVAREKRNERQAKEARKKLLKDEDQKEKAEEWMAKNNYQGSVKDVLNARADLYEAGVSEELIDNALDTEFANTGSLSGNNHDQYVDTAAFISKYNYNRDNIEDEEKMLRMEERVQSMLPDQGAQLEVMRNTAKMLGAEKIYEQRRKEGRTRIGNRNQQQTQTSQGTQTSQSQASQRQTRQRRQTSQGTQTSQETPNDQ